MTAVNGSPRARALAAALRQARNERSISLRALAGSLSMDPSNLSKIETGKNVPNIELTARILGALHTPTKECERILNMARNADEPNWLTVGIPGVTQQLSGVVENEKAASAITEWAPMLVPGLLQTTDYARSIVRANGEVNGLSAPEVETRIMVKVGRREVLFGRNPVWFDAFISESSLYDPIDSADVMIDQLRHLIEVGQRDNVSIRVVPQRIGWHPGLVGPFVLYEFAEGPSLVHFEHYSSGVFNQDIDDTAAYRKAINNINDRSMNRDDSMDYIAKVVVGQWNG